MKFVPNSVSRTAARQVLQVRKSSPSLLFAAGVVGVVVTAVLASKATLKVEDVLEKHEKALLDVHEIAREGYAEYSTEAKKEKAYVYLRTAGELGKLYGPTLVVGALSIAALTGSHRTLTKRNAALVAAYAAVEKAFDEYRERVVKDLGIDKDREYRYAMEDKKVKGEGKVKALAPGSASQYAKFFGKDYSQSWSATPEYNMLFLRGQQNYMNDRLISTGHVFLNEVYDGLGLERTSAGAVVGWVYDKTRDDHDNYIDFGIFDSRANDRFYDFVMGHEDSILLDFNVDGVIYDLI